MKTYLSCHGSLYYDLCKDASYDIFRKVYSDIWMVLSSSIHDYFTPQLENILAPSLGGAYL